MAGVRPAASRTLEFCDAERKAWMTAGQHQQGEAVDGRTARALRTRDAIVDACIGLVDEGVLKPTAPRIAERAGVSVRSVFQHFADLEHLFAAVAERATARFGRLLEPVPEGLALAERVERLVRQRCALLEEVTPLRRAATVHGLGSREITTRVQAAHDVLRSQVAAVLSSELAAFPDREREELLDRIDCALSWPTWEGLRTLGRRDPEWAERVVRRMVVDALAGAGVRLGEEGPS
jgi:TetR/AcrR family transcriptional regulator, regulator of autoinduction and epiphytic fitness